MNLDVKAELDALRTLAQSGPQFRDAANAAVMRQGDETKGAMRAHIEQRLSRRAAGTITSETHVGRDSAVAYYIHSRWWRRPARGGEAVDLLAAFERGDTIVPARGGALAMPLPAAYNVVGLSAGYRQARKAPTPQAVEIALGGQQLFMLRSKRGNVLLCAKDVAISTGRRGSIRAGSYRNRKGKTVRRKGLTEIVPMFVLLRNTRLPKRLDFSGIRAETASGLAEKLIVELGRRGVV